MKIKNGLSQFMNEKVLLAVAGERRAKFFIAGDGEINLFAEVEELVPTYGDNEGFFGGKKGGKNSRMGSPSVEVNKEYLLNKFAGKFKEKVLAAEAQGKGMPIYLFAPAFIHTMLTESLPKAMASRIKLNLTGNYLHAKPFELIEMIDKKSVSGKTIVNEKVRKLLRK